jgi:hypothetical protein
MGFFSRKVRVTMVDDRTSAVIALAKLPPERLPETFRVATTMHLGETDWSVVSATPETRAEYGKAGHLLIRVRPAEKLDAAEILYSLPTICDGLPDADGLVADGTEVVLAEDDWRQCELVSVSLRPLVEQELAAVRVIHERDRVGSGFRNVHLRRVIAAPIVAGTLSLRDLDAVLGPRSRCALRFAGAAARVPDLFAVELDDRHLMYVRHAGSVVQVIGLHPDVGPEIAAVRAFAARTGLLVVDWCRAHVTPVEDFVL